MLSKRRQYDTPGATLRGPYKVWLPPPKTVESDLDRDRARPSAAPPAPAPVAVPSTRPAPPPTRASYSTTATSATTTTTSTTLVSASSQTQSQSHAQRWLSTHAAPGQQPSLSSLSSVGSQKYSTPPTSVSSSYQVKNPRLDAVDVPVRPSSSWRSSADRSIDDRDDEARARHDKRPGTGESASSHASSRPASQQDGRADVVSPVRGEPSHWFSDRQRTHGSLTSAHATRAGSASTEIFIPSEVLQQHTRKPSFEKQRKDDPRKPNAGYLSDVTERDERTPKMQSRSPPPAPVVFPMYPPDRGAKSSVLSVAVPGRGVSPSNVPARGYSPSNVPPRGISPSNVSRYDPRSRTNSQNDPTGVRSPYSWAQQGSYTVQQQTSINTALPAEDEVVVQKLQRAKSTSGTPYPGMQPYAQAGKAEAAPIPIPSSRRTTLPGSIPSRDSHSSSHSSLQFAAPSVHGSNSAMNNINGSKTSLTATFSPPQPHVSRVSSSSSTIAQTTSMLPPQAVMHIRSRSPSQTALPASTITSPVSTRPPTAQAVTYARVHPSYMPPSTSVLSPSAQASRNLPPATPHRTSLNSLHPNQTPYPHVNAQGVNGSTQPSRSAAQTPYMAASGLPPAGSSQFATAMQNTSHLPTGRPATMAQVQARAQSPLQRMHTPPQRVQTPPRRTQSPVVVLNEQHNVQSDEALSMPPSLSATPTASRSQSRAQGPPPPPPPEAKKRASGGGIFNIFRPRKYEFWIPSTDDQASRKKEAEQRHRAEKESAKEHAKLTKAAKESARDAAAAQQKESASHRDTGSNSSHRTMNSTSSSHRRHDSSSSMRREQARDPVLMATSRPTTGFALPSMGGQFASSAPVAIPNSGRKSPVPRMPFKLFQKKRSRTVSSASLEVLDGNTTANTVVNSPASSIRSPTPGASPPLRDPGAATLEWRDKEEHELVTSGRSRRRRPGVTFDISFEDSPMAGERPKPSRHRTSTPRSMANQLPESESDDDDDDSDDDE